MVYYVGREMLLCVDELFGVPMCMYAQQVGPVIGIADGKWHYLALRKEGRVDRCITDALCGHTLKQCLQE